MVIMSNLVAILAMLAAQVLAPFAGAEEPTANSCLYPVPHERFAVAAPLDLNRFDLSSFPAGSYLDWRVNPLAPHPNGMVYYPMLNMSESGFSPSGSQLRELVLAHPNAAWIVGNEAETIWMENVTPETYARHFHDIYTTIKSVDPNARFVISGVAQVSVLRLAWLDRAWDAYRNMYGTDMPVDIWNIHPYVVNEMHQEWGSEIPTGIPNAVGYTGRDGADWSQASHSGANAGTVHQSNVAGARAYFAFHGSSVTIYLATGPDSGIAEIYLDQGADPVETVDLYAGAPGMISRTYSGLPDPGGRQTDRHNIRAQVTGRQNPASSGTWVRVDAIRAPSTTGLSNGLFDDSDPLRARILTTVEDHDNIDLVEEQVRDFRRWMASKGQRNKPLINTEHGILMTEDLGFDYSRVRTFMFDSFDLFINDMQDPQLGMPDDGNRLLQQWFWYALTQDTFQGRTSATGLFDGRTGALKPLGQDYINYVGSLYRTYVDLGVSPVTLDPVWPLFSGEQALVRLRTTVYNQGNLPSGASVARLASGGSTVTDWTVAGLPMRTDSGVPFPLAHQWHQLVNGPTAVTVTADVNQQLDDPCRDNNVRTAALTPPDLTDLAVVKVRRAAGSLPAVPWGEPITVRLQADVLNMGGVGTSANQLAVRFWLGAPDAGGVLLSAQTLARGGSPVPVTVTYDWPDVAPGQYDIYVTVDGAPEDIRLDNNRASARIFVPFAAQYLPHVSSSGTQSRASIPATDIPDRGPGIRLPLP